MDHIIKALQFIMDKGSPQEEAYAGQTYLK